MLLTADDEVGQPPPSNRAPKGTDRIPIISRCDVSFREGIIDEKYDEHY